MPSVKRSTSKETFKLLVSTLHCVAPLTPPHGFLSVPTLRLLLNFWTPPKSFNTKKELRQGFALSSRLGKSNLKICKWHNEEHNFPDIEFQIIYLKFMSVWLKSPQELQKICHDFVSNFQIFVLHSFSCQCRWEHFIAISENRSLNSYSLS